jgi:hypothetical protein
MAWADQPETRPTRPREVPDLALPRVATELSQLGSNPGTALQRRLQPLATLKLLALSTSSERNLEEAVKEDSPPAQSPPGPPTFVGAMDGSMPLDDIESAAQLLRAISPPPEVRDPAIALGRPAPRHGHLASTRGIHTLPSEAAVAELVDRRATAGLTAAPPPSTRTAGPWRCCGSARAGRTSGEARPAAAQAARAHRTARTRARGVGVQGVCLSPPGRLLTHLHAVFIGHYGAATIFVEL